MKERPLIFFAHSAGSQNEPGEGSYSLVRNLKRELSDEFEILFRVIEDPDAPTYAKWKKLFAKEFKSKARPIIFIGHSLGGSALLKYLSEERPELVIPAMFLIAMPQWGKDGWDVEEYILKADPGISATTEVFLYHCKNDPVVPFEHLHFYTSLFPDVTIRTLPGEDHAFEDGLPELVKDIRSLRTMDRIGH